MLGQFGIDFQNSDTMRLTYSGIYEFLPVPLRLAPGVSVPVGGYDYGSVSGAYGFGPQRRLFSGNASLEYGRFYEGDKTTLTLAASRTNFPPHLSIEPSYSLNKVDLPQGSFTTNLVGARVTYDDPADVHERAGSGNSVTHSVSANVRLRWEYQPGSELFVVYTSSATRSRWELRHFQTAPLS